MKSIGPFEGEYSFLSNFYVSPIQFDNTICQTLEHAYQASKTIDLQQRKQILQAKSPAEAKKLGRKCKVIPNWDSVKVKIMYQLIRMKFSKEPLKTKLINTNDIPLVEYNWWGDKFWGVDTKTNQGNNYLGKILMEIREELKGNVIKMF